MRADRPGPRRRAADAAELVHDGQGVVAAGGLARGMCSPNNARLRVYIVIVAPPQTDAYHSIQRSSDIASGSRTGLGATTKQATSGLSNPMHARVGATDYAVVGARASARAVQPRFDQIQRQCASVERLSSTQSVPRRLVAIG
jgi:hypothetical protein